MQDFRKVFPCPNESVKKEIKKLLEKVPLSQQVCPCTERRKL